jgi:hypothetical protein
MRDEKVVFDMLPARFALVIGRGGAETPIAVRECGSRAQLQPMAMPIAASLRVPYREPTGASRTSCLLVIAIIALLSSRNRTGQRPVATGPWCRCRCVRDFYAASDGPSIGGMNSRCKRPAFLDTIAPRRNDIGGSVPLDLFAEARRRPVSVTSRRALLLLGSTSIWSERLGPSSRAGGARCP